jgi:hypothetical protein
LNYPPGAELERQAIQTDDYSLAEVGKKDDQAFTLGKVAKYLAKDALRMDGALSQSECPAVDHKRFAVKH